MRSASNTSKALRRARSARAAAACGLVAYAQDGIGQGCRVARRHEQPERAIVQDLATGADVARDHRHARGHGLDQRDAQAFVRGGGEHEQIQLADQLGHVAAHAEQADAIADAFCGDQRLELAAAAALADQPDLAVETPTPEPAGGADQRRLVLVRLEARDHADAKARGLALPAGHAGALGEGGDRHAIVDHRGLGRGHAEACNHPFLDVAAAADERRRGGAAELDLGAELVEARRRAWSDSCRHAPPRGARRRAGRRRP